MQLVSNIEERPEQYYVGIPATARLSEFGEVNALIPQVYGWLADHGVTPAGGTLYRYFSIGAPDEPVDISVNVPVTAPVPATQGIVAGSLPAGRYVVGRHRGSPDEVREAHASLQDWAKSQGLTLAVHERDGREYWDARGELLVLLVLDLLGFLHPRHHPPRASRPNSGGLPAGPGQGIETLTGVLEAQCATLRVQAPASD